MTKRMISILCFIMVVLSGNTIAQENVFSHFFSASSYYNPAFAGDTRFSHVQTVNRIQPTISSATIYNSSLSYDQKLLNHHSGFGFNVSQKSAVLKETQFKLNYSYTFLVTQKLLIKAGVGISWNIINTYAESYMYPDQFNDYEGYTGNPTLEPAINEKSAYPGFTSGFVLYSSLWWFSAGFDNLNRPKHEFAGTEVYIPLTYSCSAGYMFPLDRDKLAKRYFDRDGGLNPYSSLGPVISFYKHGPFHVSSIGINAFNKPVFWGLSYRYSTKFNHVLSNGVSSLNALVGYRNQSLSLAYSYDFMISRTPTNYKGAHEISILFYFFSIKEDHRRHGLIPLPNQLMY